MLAAPLTSLLTKEEFHWTVEADVAFNKLKHAMTHSLVLAHKTFRGGDRRLGFGYGCGAVPRKTPDSFF